MRGTRPWIAHVAYGYGAARHRTPGSEPSDLPYGNAVTEYEHPDRVTTIRAAVRVEIDWGLLTRNDREVEGLGICAHRSHGNLRERELLIIRREVLHDQVGAVRALHRGCIA